MELLRIFRNRSFPPPYTKLKIRCYVVPLVQWSSDFPLPMQSTLKKIFKIYVSLCTCSSSHLKAILSYIQMLPKDVSLFCTHFCFGFLSSLSLGPQKTQSCLLAMHLFQSFFFLLPEVDYFVPLYVSLLNAID